MCKLIDKNTDNLMTALCGANPAQVQTYIQQNFSQGQPDFVGYVDELLSQKHMKRQEVLLRANLPQKYGYKLLTGEAHTTDRDKLLRICFAMQLTLKETQRMLKLYGMNELYPKNKRDVMLIVALGRKQFDIDQINAELAAQSLQPLYPPEAEEPEKKIGP